ncbi:hypothetical protein D3C77_361870 [compost metagenome]
MNLSIQSLKEMGAFTGAPVKKTIKWQQGGEELQGEVFVRPLGYRAAVSDLIASAGMQDGIAGRIAASICNEAGEPVFTVADITGDADPERGSLDRNLTTALLTAIGEVNNLGKTQSSATSTKSGTKSPSRSPARSRKPKSA